MTDRHHGITHSANTPYFAYVSLNAPHAPYIAPDEYKKRFLDAGYDEKTAGRYGMIENIDDNVGRLMSKLNEWGALDNTLIIFMTDNGMSMPAMIKEGKKIIPYNAGLKGRKNSPYEGGTYVPMYWQWKGVLDSNIDIDKLTAHIDLYPTLSELAGAKSPKTMQQLDGRSLLPLLHHSNPVWDDRKLFIHIGRWKQGQREAAKYGKYAVRTQQWRLVNNNELYDVNLDPGEKKQPRRYTS